MCLIDLFFGLDATLYNLHYLLAAVNLVLIFRYPRVACLCVPVREKDKALDQGRGSLYFQGFPEALLMWRGSSLVKLVGHDSSVFLWLTVQI